MPRLPEGSIEIAEGLGWIAYVDTDGIIKWFDKSASIQTADQEETPQASIDYFMEIWRSLGKNYELRI